MELADPTAEMEGIQAGTSRDVAQLTSRLQGLERAPASDRVVWTEERKQAGQQIEDASQAMTELRK